MKTPGKIKLSLYLCLFAGAALFTGARAASAAFQRLNSAVKTIAFGAKCTEYLLEIHCHSLSELAGPRKTPAAVAYWGLL